MVVTFDEQRGYGRSWRHRREILKSAADNHRVRWDLVARWQCWRFNAVALSALVLTLHATALGGPFVFGLDNRPQAPISIDPAGIGNGAEDPFGLVLAPTLVGPSPSLNTFVNPPGRTLSDADILVPGVNAPQINTVRPLNTNYVDAISTNLAPIDGSPLRLAFSVDRASSGVLQTAVREQFDLNQQPGDIFLSGDFPEPGQFVGTLVGSGWVGNLSSTGSGDGNLLLLNQSTLKLKAGEAPGMFTDETDPAPAIAAGTHDNVDAFDISFPDTSGDLIADTAIYYSVNPGQSAIIPFVYGSAASIYRTQPGSLVPTSFASAFQLGLDTMFANEDDVDGLIVFDLGVPGSLDPGVDYALFSLSPGSRSLLAHGLTAADVFFTDFQQSFATYATDADLGLAGTAHPAELGGGSGSLASSAGISGPDNLDALGGYPLGDMDWNGTLDFDDVDDFVQGLTRPDDYRDLNLDHFGKPATILGDFSMPRDGIVDFDDIPPFRIAIEGGGAPLLGQSVPEPVALTLMAISFVVLMNPRERLPQRRTPRLRWFAATQVFAESSIRA